MQTNVVCNTNLQLHVHKPAIIKATKSLTIVGERVCEGFSDGCDWIVTRSCVCHHREMREMCMMTTLAFNEYVYEYKGNACLILLT